LPSQVPEHEPVQDTLAPALPVQEPLQETSSLPRSHVGGFALTSHFALPEQPPWQLALALTLALH
jgi:hypothetical protein